MPNDRTKRRIVQIAAIAPAEAMARVYALCDDGSLWMGTPDSRAVFHWCRLPDVPQDEGTPGFAGDKSRAA
jgi:hypothetical protein